MKKTVIKTLALLAVFFTALTQASALTAKIVSVTGKVEVLRGETWVALNAGDTLTTGDVISTGFKSEAEISINTSTVKLGALTRITVEKLLDTETMDDTKLFLDSGTITANVNKDGDRKVGFKVSSPVATASVRGTFFKNGADGFLETFFGLVNKGLPEAKKARIETFVPANGTSSVFTPVADINGEAGIPVFEGQTSSTDTGTGTSSTPQQQFVYEASDIGGSTSTLAATESESTYTSTGVVTTADTAGSSGSGNIQAKTTLVLNLDVQE